MTLTEQLERQLALKLSHTEKIHKQLSGLCANEYTQNILKATTLVSASNEKIYLCTITDYTFHCREIAYDEISAICHRKRILSGLEIIIHANKQRFSISHIETGCPIEFTQFIHSKKADPYFTTA